MSISHKPHEYEAGLYRKAIERWGIASQVSMAQGECGELIAALTQCFTQGKGSVQAVASELADVEIMCSQLRLVLDQCGFTHEMVDEVKAAKLCRLNGILHGHIDHPHQRKGEA